MKSRSIPVSKITKVSSIKIGKNYLLPFYGGVILKIKSIEDGWCTTTGEESLTLRMSNLISTWNIHKIPQEIGVIKSRDYARLHITGKKE